MSHFSKKNSPNHEKSFPFCKIYTPLQYCRYCYCYYLLLCRYKAPFHQLRIAYGTNKGKNYTEEEDR